MPEEIKNPTAGEAGTPEIAQEHAPSSDQPETTDIPSTDKPQPDAKKPAAKAPADRAAAAKAPADKDAAAKPPADRAAAAKAPADKDAAAKAPADKAAAAKAPKKEKAPALEDKPFAEFIQQDYLPALQTALDKQGVKDLNLTFAKQKFAIAGLNAAEECWQIIGKFQGGQRQFNLYFPKEDIQAQRAFSCAENGTKTSTLEPFLIDERKVTLDLMVFGVVQRLNAQKWLKRN